MNVQKFLAKNSASILTGLSALGTLATAVLTGYSTVKAVKAVDKLKKPSKKDIVKETWKYYIPPALICTSTLICTFSSNALNKKQQASLASAYALIQNSYKEYKKKLKELYGEEAHEKIIDSIAVEKAEEVSISTSYSGISLDFDISSEPEVVRTFYDTFSGRCFESTIEKVIQAEYHLNRNFLFNGVIPLNEFYTFLGIDPTKDGDTVGWSSANGDIYWIDFSHHKLLLEDGMEILVIDMVFEPTAEWLEDM